MPYIDRRGYLKIARESAPGTLSTSALAGAAYGPLSAMMATTGPWAVTTPGFGILTNTRDLEAKYEKHVSAAQVGRREADVIAVAGRRQMAGTFQVPVTPDTFGYLLFLGLGVDVVTPAATGALSGAGNTANATSLTVSATSVALKAGQRIWIKDATAGYEYVSVLSNVASGVTSIPITGGAGTGGGLKFSHAAAVVIQFGPWTHVFNPSNAANGIPTFQIEHNWGGAPNSLLYTTASIDKIEIAAPIESATDAITATVSVVGLAPSTPAGITGSGAFTLPVEEVPIAAGNAATFTATGATLPQAPFANIYVPDFKATISNKVKLVAASAGSPDPYASIVTALTLQGSMEAIFEGGYETFQDYANTNIWAPAAWLWTWADTVLTGSTGALPPTLALSIQRMLLENTGKPNNKDEIVTLPIGNWRALDYPDFTNLMTFTVVNNIAQY